MGADGEKWASYHPSYNWIGADASSSQREVPCSLLSLSPLSPHFPDLLLPTIQRNKVHFHFPLSVLFSYPILLVVHWDPRVSLSCRISCHTCAPSYVIPFGLLLGEESLREELCLSLMMLL